MKTGKTMSPLQFSKQQTDVFKLFVLLGGIQFSMIERKIKDFNIHNVKAEDKKKWFTKRPGG